MDPAAYLEGYLLKAAQDQRPLSELEVKRRRARREREALRSGKAAEQKRLWKETFAIMRQQNPNLAAPNAAQTRANRAARRKTKKMDMYIDLAGAPGRMMRAPAIKPRPAVQWTPAAKKIGRAVTGAVGKISDLVKKLRGMSVADIERGVTQGSSE